MLETRTQRLLLILDLLDSIEGTWPLRVRHKHRHTCTCTCSTHTLTHFAPNTHNVMHIPKKNTHPYTHIIIFYYVKQYSQFNTHTYTDQSGWGNSIYINGTLIPRLIVQRGRTYTFICETGKNPDPFVPGGGNYHPFYITDSKTGGRLTSSEIQQSVSSNKLKLCCMMCTHTSIL